MKLTYTSQDSTWKSYRAIQKANKIRFNNLTKNQQKQLREKGYKNSGKANVKMSHNLLNNYYPEVQKQKFHYYVVVNDNQYANHDELGLHFWPKSLAQPYRSYEFAEQLANYIRQEEPSSKVEIESEPI